MNSLSKTRLAAACFLMFGMGGLAMAREVIDFDANWKFALNDQPGADAPVFDDSGWRVLNVPHDWAFEADYAEDAAQTDRGGYKPGGMGWYRKTFELPGAWRGKHIRIEFDAVYMNSEVWINGEYLGKWPYGYASFQYDLTAHVRPGKNVLSVKVEGPVVRQTWEVKKPLRWDVDTPHLYTVVSRVKDDEVFTRFGIRTIRWDTETGFWLNGNVVKLKGVADHLEAGPVGAAYPDELLRWKIQQIKEMGCNSIRTAHNPQTPVFYDLVRMKVSTGAVRRRWLRIR